MKKKYWGFLAAFSLIVGGLVLLQQATSNKKNLPAQAPSQFEVSQLVPAVSQSVDKKDLSSKFTKPSDEIRETEESWSWDRFLQKYGRSLEPDFSPQGVLLSIRTPHEGGLTRASDFNSENSESILSRSREILGDLKEVLGVSLEHLGDVVVRGTSISAHAYYRQNIDSIPLQPYGTVSMDLGPQGELIGFYSTLVPGAHLRNHRTLSVGEVRAIVLSTLNPRPAHFSEGGAIIWVPAPGNLNGGRTSEAYHAYSYLADGVEIIANAENARILARRDRKIR